MARGHGTVRGPSSWGGGGSGGGGAGVQEIVAGDGIAVDDTDPSAPIVSASGTSVQEASLAREADITVTNPGDEFNLIFDTIYDEDGADTAGVMPVGMGLEVVDLGSATLYDDSESPWDGVAEGALVRATEPGTWAINYGYNAGNDATGRTRTELQGDTQSFGGDMLWSTLDVGAYMYTTVIRLKAGGMFTTVIVLDDLTAPTDITFVLCNIIRLA